MKKLKKLAAEFKAFISRGNVVDMAVAVIIGAAFSAIVTTLTDNILKPLINWAVGGGEGIGLITMLKPVTLANGEIDMTNSIYIDWGTFIMKIIDFLLIALVLFIIIKVFMGLKNATANAHDKAKAKLVKKLEKQGMSAQEAEAKAEAAVVEQEAAAPAQPTTEELLIQIRDLLSAQQAQSATKAEPANDEKAE